MAAVNEHSDNKYAIGALVSPDHTFLVTPNDDEELPYVALGVLISNEGSLHFIDGKGEEVTLPSGALAAQVQYSFRIRKVFEDSTATGIVCWT